MSDPVYTIFYVDFEGGDDTHDGTSPATAWKHIPGTRTLDGSAWLVSSFAGGTYQPSIGHKLPYNSRIRIKAGSRYNGDWDGSVCHAGFIWLDRNWLTDGSYEDNRLGVTPIGSSSAWDQYIFEGYYESGWGTEGAPVIFDGQHFNSTQIGICLVYCMVDGTTWTSPYVRGMQFINSPRGGLQIKTKQNPNTYPVLWTKCVNCYGENNGTSFITDGAGATEGSINIVKAAGVRLTACEFNGAGNFINGVMFGDSNLSVTDALVTDCVAYGHHGTYVDNDSGIAFKAVNSQITWRNCHVHDNLKGFDMGQQSGSTPVYYDAEYWVIGCHIHGCTWGVNTNCSATAGFDKTHKCYLVGNLIHDVTYQGVNAYSGPFDLWVLHNTFFNNGSLLYTAGSEANPSGNGGTLTCHIRINPDTAADTRTITAHVRNNIFHTAQHWVGFTAIFAPATNDLTLDINDNVYVQGGTEGFWHWASSTGGQSADFTFGADGPGHGATDSAGHWQAWYGKDTTPPTLGTGHFGCDTRSKGTGCLDTQVPSFTDADDGDYTLTGSFPGANLSTEIWYNAEMGTDPTGRARTEWTMGAFEYVPEAVPVVETDQDPVSASTGAIMFGELLTIVADRLNQDEFFTTARLHVIPEDLGDFINAMDKSMELGMLLVVSFGGISRDTSDGSYTVELRLAGTEDVLKNRDAAGSGKALWQVLEAAWQIICDGQWTAGEVWSEFECSGFTAPALDEFGMVNRALEFKATTTSTNK